ncbi:MAG TPA: hypothetical protein DD381_05350 [Lentisphaeria bacterium]|nr:MAG: hypothetical protein A2X47_01570 [Lentisphaerae bacterium GWF2_38_69]HBM15756.1 hypothetical protein [Lentisphaeria bacterium]
MIKHIGKIFSVNTSKERGTIKYALPEILIKSQGIEGDAHYGHSDRHLSIISIERIEEFSKEINTKINPGEFAENITTSGLDLTKVKLHDCFRIGTAELEVIQIGKPEVYRGDGSGVFRIIGKSVMLHEGLFCKVITEGKVRTGDKIEHYEFSNKPN